VSGNKAAGTVTESYEYSDLERPVVNWEKGQRAALEKCAAWGYTSAQAFGGAKTQCEAANAYGCTLYRVTVEYQCTGGDEPRQAAK
jgi:hypothetical protein